jgi:hypothetical protein
VTWLTPTVLVVRRVPHKPRHSSSSKWSRTKSQAQRLISIGRGGKPSGTEVYPLLYSTGSLHRENSIISRMDPLTFRASYRSFVTACTLSLGRWLSMLWARFTGNPLGYLRILANYMKVPAKPANSNSYRTYGCGQRSSKDGV